MKKSLLLSLLWVVGVICYGQQPESQTRLTKRNVPLPGLNKYNQETIKKPKVGLPLGDFREKNCAEPASTVYKTSEDAFYQTTMHGFHPVKQRLTENVLTDVVPHKTAPDLSDDHCFYTFTLLDSWGDGWNGALMQVIQSGETIAVLGPEFDFGHQYVQQVSLNHGVVFEVFWQEGGYYPWEVGLVITDPFDEQVYYAENLSWDDIETTIFSDVAICTPPTCPRPSNLLLVSADTESALVTWTENGGAFQWDIEYGGEGFDDGEGTVIAGITGKPFLLTGLEPATMYEFRVRAFCSQEDISIWSTRKSFSTLCDAFPLPLAEGFDVVSPPQLPLCWTPMGAGAVYFVETSDYTYVSAPNSVYMGHTGFSVVMLVAPPLDEPVNNVQLRFKTLRLYATNNLHVGVITNPSDESTFTLVQTIIPDEYGAWSEHLVLFSGYTGADGRIAFRIGSLNDEYFGFYFIDDVEINYLQSCHAPYNPGASNITAGSALLQWDDFGTGEEWEIEWGTAPFSPGSGMLVQGIFQKSYALTGLAGSSTYQFYVRAVCSEGQASNWSSDVVFSTLCDIFSLPLSEGFDNVTPDALPLCWTETGTGYYYVATTDYDYFSPPYSVWLTHADFCQAMLIVPPLNELISNVQLGFKTRPVHFFGTLDVGVITDPDDESTFFVVQSFNIGATNVWTDRYVNFTGYTGPDGRIAFRSQDIYYRSILIDDIKITILDGYNVTFRVFNAAMQPVEGASIEIEGAGSITTQANGEATLMLQNGHYQYAVNSDDYHGYSGDFTIQDEHLILDIILLTLNVKEGVFTDVVLFPNPFGDQFFVKNGEEIKKITVLNTLGQTVLEQELAGDHSIGVRTAGLVKGVYFVQLHHKNGAHSVQKIIKR